LIEFGGVRVGDFAQSLNGRMKPIELFVDRHRLAWLLGHTAPLDFADLIRTRSLSLPLASSQVFDLVGEPVGIRTPFGCGTSSIRSLAAIRVRVDPDHLSQAHA
jgi:hypothetical protein